MPNTIDEAFVNLRRLFDEQFRLQSELDRILTGTSAAELERKGRYYLRKIREKQTGIKAYIQEDSCDFPPITNRHHSEELRRFHEIASYDKSIFIMTKFPLLFHSFGGNRLCGWTSELRTSMAVARYVYEPAATHRENATGLIKLLGSSLCSKHSLFLLGRFAG